MKDKLLIKIGSLGVTQKSGGADEEKIKSLLEQIDYFKNKYDIILVSSGAIHTAKEITDLKFDKNQNIVKQQALSAIGQPKLMSAYQKVADQFKIKIAQILVTHEDFKNQKRILNIRNTLNFLLQNNFLPIINENDTVSFDEITLGDNDQLAAMVAQVLGVHQLVILSEVDALYSHPPQDPKAQKISMVQWDDELLIIKASEKNFAGRGGMSTKLRAVRKLTPLGIEVYLGSFLVKDFLKLILAKKTGTFFAPNPTKKASIRQAWLSTLSKVNSLIKVDEGCAKALVEKKSSLLPVGVIKTSGNFRRGDVIQIAYKNSILGVGISEYSSGEIEKIKGKKSEEIIHILPTAPSKVIIHRDNLFLKKETL